jgi:hypothetical protein
MGEKEIDQNEVADAAVYLFNRWTRETKIEPDQFPELQPADFLSWLTTHMPPITPFEVVANVEGKCSVEAVELIFQVANDPQGPQKIMGMWPFMIMSGRGNKHKVVSFQFLTVLTYEDDVVVPLSIFAHQDVIEGEIDDGAVVSFMTAKVPNITGRIMQDGLDKLHDSHNAENFGPIEDTLKEIHQFIQIHGRSFGPLKLKKIEDTLVFLTSMFPKEVPESTKQELREIGRRNEASEGGWEVPG